MSNHARRRKPLDLDRRLIVEPTFWQRLAQRFTPTPSPGPVAVATVASRVEAETVAGFLRSHGINAHISADDAGGVDPFLQVTLGVRVLVAHNKESEARRLLARADS